MLIEHCYGYPLGGEFIRIDYCYDIPRILHCHVNPSVQRFIGGGYAKLTISMFGARMRNYKSDKPLTVTNPNAVIQAFGCFDKYEEPFNLIPANK